MPAPAAPTSIADDELLGELVSRFEAGCPNADGVWNCDVGAAAAAWLADELGIARLLRSGFFWHESEEGYNATMLYEPDSEDWATWRDEAHCWVELIRPYGVVLLDPNGERVLPDPRPRLCLLDSDAGELMADDEWVSSPYEPVNGERDCVAYETDEDIEALSAHDRTLREGLTRLRAGFVERPAGAARV